MTGHTAFAVGDLVRAKVTAQGMTAGLVYRVAAVHPCRTIVGTLVQYDLVRASRTWQYNAETIRVGNGWLLLARVTDDDATGGAL